LARFATAAGIERIIYAAAYQGSKVMDMPR
jgi:hypothetical protein